MIVFDLLSKSYFFIVVVCVCVQVRTTVVTRRLLTGMIWKKARVHMSVAGTHSLPHNTQQAYWLQPWPSPSLHNILVFPCSCWTLAGQQPLTLASITKLIINFIFDMKNRKGETVVWLKTVALYFSNVLEQCIYISSRTSIIMWHSFVVFISPMLLCHMFSSWCCGGKCDLIAFWAFLPPFLFRMRINGFLI